MSVPVNTIDNIPTTSSQAAAWIEWHRALRRRYGKSAANTTWLKAWSARGSSAANTAELRAYLAEQGMSIDGTAFSWAADGWEKLKDTFSFTGSLTKWALVAAVLVVLLFLFNLARKPETVTEAIKPSLI